MLPQGRTAEASAPRHDASHDPRAASCRLGLDCDPRAQGAAVADCSHQFQFHPVIPVPWTHEKSAREDVSRELAAEDLENVQLTVPIHVTNRGTASFLQMRDARFVGNILERT